MQVRYLTKRESLKFKHWLLNNDMSMIDFSKKINVSKQLLSAVFLGNASLSKKTEDKIYNAGYIDIRR